MEACKRKALQAGLMKMVVGDGFEPSTQRGQIYS